MGTFITEEILSEGGITGTTISGGTFFGNGSGLSSVTASFNGGTVTGGTNFTGGLTANTFSATTITGGTFYGDGSNLTGISSSGAFTGGTVTGATNFTNGLTANTISATTITGGTLYGSGTNLTGVVNSLTTSTGLSANTTTGNITILNTAPDQTVTLNNGSGMSITGTYPSFTISNTGETYVTGFTYSNNTFRITDNFDTAFTSTINTVTGLTINGNLTVTGNTSVSGLTGTSATISGIGQNILTVIGSGNSTTAPIFTIQGSSGELFSVNDSLVGSLFTVNDISGLPIFEVNSNGTTLIGSYLYPSLNTTVKTTITAGTNTIYSIPTSAYTGAFFDYTLISTGSTGARAGTILSIWSGSTAEYTDVSTKDIGTTTGVTFSVTISGNNAVLNCIAVTTGWTLKTIVRSI